MKEIIATFQNIVTVACIAVLLAILFCCVSSRLRTIFKNGWCSFVCLGFTIFMIYVGGSKNITSKTSTDEGIDLIEMDMSVSNVVEEVEGVVQTNFHSRILTIKVTDESPIPFPMSFRENYYQPWTNVTSVATFDTPQPVLNSEQSGNGTNVYVWISRDWTNNFSHANWYIGTDLPAVHVDVDDTGYIVVDEFCITSKRVRIKFHLNPEFSYPEGTMIEVQRQIDNKRFEVVEEIEAVREGVFVWRGFEVGKRTKWRLHMAISTD